MHIEHQGMRDASLQTVLQPTSKPAGQREVVAAAIAREVGDLAVLRIGPAEFRIHVVAGRRIVEQVRIVAARVAIPVPADEIGLDRHYPANLFLEAGAVLPRVRHFEIRRQDSSRLRWQRNFSGQNVGR